MNTIIKVENLSKKYIIGHNSNERYTALRDVIANKVITTGRKFKNFFSFNHQHESTNNRYEEFWALKDINFEVNQGDRIGIIGKNGAGKSTLLKILSRITEPTGGSVKIKGKVASLLEVGTGFHPELTGRENIYLNGAILGMSRAEVKKKFDEIVDFSGVEKFLDTPVKRFSSGMYVRLAFSVAAYLDPEILVVDEVLAVGDAEFQKKCLGKMEDVSKNEGRTVLFVSHNLTAVKQLCSNGIVLTKGMLSFSGSSEEAVQNYLLESSKERKITHQKYDDSNCPGGEIAELLEYSLLNSESKKIDKFNLYEEALIEIVFRVKKRGFCSFANIHFFNQEDRCIFAVSTNYDTQIVTEGIYKTTFTINANTFNVGIYKAGIAVTCYPGIDIQFFINPAITFEVEESNIELRKIPFTGAIPGEFRPQLRNHTIKI